MSCPRSRRWVGNEWRNVWRLAALDTAAAAPADRCRDLASASAGGTATASPTRAQHGDTSSRSVWCSCRTLGQQGHAVLAALAIADREFSTFEIQIHTQPFAIEEKKRRKGLVLGGWAHLQHLAIALDQARWSGFCWHGRGSKLLGVPPQKPPVFLACYHWLEPLPRPAHAHAGPTARLLRPSPQPVRP